MCGGIEATQFSAPLEVLDSIILHSRPDAWRWELDSTRVFFSVQSVRCHINDFRLSVGNFITRWNRFITIKVDVFMWWVLLDQIPMKSNVDLRGIDLDTVLCPMCGLETEDNSHLFFKC